jgi:hypothetical protein
MEVASPVEHKSTFFSLLLLDAPPPAVPPPKTTAEVPNGQRAAWGSPPSRLHSPGSAQRGVRHSRVDDAEGLGTKEKPIYDFWRNYRGGFLAVCFFRSRAWYNDCPLLFFFFRFP